MKGGPTPVSLLLTNLRLLDFDFQSFPITTDAFSQSSANKSKTFEHIIYHLYHTFDPEECELKLRRCWPVYEGAQGKELRSVVYTWLEELKKAGKLPGVLLRRSTLDDCAGLRYEELMVSLSTMVLKERVEAGAFGGVKSTPSYRHATSFTPSSEHIDPLNYAYEYGLRSVTDARNRSKAQWKSFSELLDQKETEVGAVIEKIGADETEELPASPKRPYGYEENIRNKWKNNWIGEPQWLDILLNGDPEFTRDHLLELPFDQALQTHHHYTGNGILGPKGVASLKELENKVKFQQDRVERMRQLKDRIGFSAVPAKVSPMKVIPSREKDKRGLKVTFRRHLDLHFGKTDVPRRRSTMRNTEYAELLKSLQDELILASGANPRNREGSQHPEHTHSPYNHPRAVPTSPLYSHGDVMDTDGEPEHEPAEESFYNHQTINDESIHNTSPIKSPPSTISKPPSPTHSDNDDNELFDDDDDIFLSLGILPRKSTPPSDNQDWEQNITTSSSTSHRDLSEDELMEDAPRYVDPTPRKQTPTNNTMRRKNQFDDIPYLEPATTASKKQRKSPLEESTGYMDDELLAQQIISGITRTTFSPEKPSPLKSHPPPTSGAPYAYNPRPLAPQNNEQHEEEDSSLNLPSIYNSTLATPRPPNATTSKQSTTPKEDLLVSEDYSSVFKSRPKVALSPPFSPVNPRRRVSDFGTLDDGMDNGEDEDEALEDEEMSFCASPLRGKGSRW